MNDDTSDTVEFDSEISLPVVVGVKAIVARTPVPAGSGTSSVNENPNTTPLSALNEVNWGERSDVAPVNSTPDTVNWNPPIALDEE